MKKRIRELLKPLILLLVKMKIHPNILTSIHFILGFLSAYLILRRLFLSGGILYLISSTCDFLDGAVAEFSGKKTKVGAIYDSVSDRIQEGIILLAIALIVKEFLLPFIALFTGFLISYTKTRAEAEGIKVNVGLFTRPIRSIVLGVTIIFKLFPSGLYVLIVGNTITFLHRFIYAFVKGRRQK